MKGLHVLSLSLAVLCAATANAQKKTWIVEVDGSFDHQDYSNQSLDGWGLNVAAGRQLSKHFTVGAAAGFANNQYWMPVYQTNNGPGPTQFLANDKYVRTLTNVSLWGRYTYYFSPRLYVYSQLTAGTMIVNDDKRLSSNYSYYTPITPVDYPSTTLRPLGGQFINFFPAIGFNISHGYRVQVNVGGINYSHNGTVFGEYNHVKIDFGHQFLLGLHKIIGWKKGAPAAEKE